MLKRQFCDLIRIKKDLLPNGPSDSIAIGTNTQWSDKSWYLNSLLDAASSVALPTPADVAVSIKLLWYLQSWHPILRMKNNDLVVMAVKSGYQVSYHLFEGVH